MSVFEIATIEMDLLDDLFVEYGDLCVSSENTILKLESDPDNLELVHGLMRNVHTIKGSFHFIRITPLVDLLQHLESVLDRIRDGSFRFETVVGDITLLVLDCCTNFLDALKSMTDVEYDRELFESVADLLKQAADSSADQIYAVLIRILSLLDPSTAQLPEATNSQRLLQRFQIDANDDLLFILDLAEKTQSRAEFWQGRIERVLAWLIGLNEYAGEPVQREQLLVAVCLHDIGMALLPANVINKRTPLTPRELRSVKNHVSVASQLATSFPDWQEAKIIIDQHQENFDGSGYPQGLAGDEICAGAQLLSIVHAYEAITHGYSKNLSSRRPIMRAVMELNRHSGLQFNPRWVDAFLEMAQAIETP